jgi:ribosomal protein S18 acetylase RimI-like enzyme
MITYRPVQSDEYEAIRLFFVEMGWDARVQDKERFYKMIANADRTVIALDGERIVGFARALTDGVSNGYIGTVAVAPDLRGRGIGRQIIEHLTGDDPNIIWVLRAGHDSGPFWQKVGFRHSEWAMERPRG